MKNRKMGQQQNIVFELFPISFKRHISKVLLLSFWSLLLLIFLASCGSEKPQQLTIATAANMQFAMKALVEEFEKETGINCQTILGSSGKLTAQISAGAPYDILVSADMRYPSELHNKGLTAAPPRVYAYGQLVLWTMKAELEPHTDLLQNSSAGIRHIAMANPDIAPYGKAAAEVMQSLQIYNRWEDKLVFGESVAQVNQFITSESAEIGFTAKSVVMAPNLAGKGKWAAIDSSLYAPIAQGIVVLNNREEMKEAAGNFYDFLFSDAAKEIMDKFGYTPAQE